eukprot:356466-Chlamydomonas_euryale.AAC.2
MASPQAQLSQTSPRAPHATPATPHTSPHLQPTFDGRCLRHSSCADTTSLSVYDSQSGTSSRPSYQGHSASRRLNTASSSGPRASALFSSSHEKTVLVGITRRSSSWVSNARCETQGVKHRPRSGG